MTLSHIMRRAGQSETRVSGCITLGWFRKEGADAHSFARFADTEMKTVSTCCNFAIGILRKNSAQNLGDLASLLKGRQSEPLAMTGALSDLGTVAV